MVTLKARHRFDVDSIEYLCICDAFKLIGHGARATEYTLEEIVKEVKAVEDDKSGHELVKLVLTDISGYQIKSSSGMVECMRCHGLKFIHNPTRDNSKVNPLRIYCPECKGKGEVEDEAPKTTK